MNSTLTLNGYRFANPVLIKPNETYQGSIEEYMPQSRYPKKHLKPLNRHGAGPFCRFAAVGLPSKSGIYVLTVNEEPRYIGKTANLAKRWGPQGYGAISPANCYLGGQSTNCRINHEILLAARTGRRIEVWARVENESNLDRIERKLILSLNPSWNIQQP